MIVVVAIALAVACWVIIDRERRLEHLQVAVGYYKGEADAWRWKYNNEVEARKIYQTMLDISEYNVPFPPSIKDTDYDRAIRRCIDT